MGIGVDKKGVILYIEDVDLNDDGILSIYRTVESSSTLRMWI